MCVQAGLAVPNLGVQASADFDNKGEEFHVLSLQPARVVGFMMDLAGPFPSLPMSVV